MATVTQPECDKNVIDNIIGLINLGGQKIINSI